MINDALPGRRFKMSDRLGMGEGCLKPSFFYAFNLDMYVNL